MNKRFFGSCPLDHLDNKHWKRKRQKRKDGTMNILELDSLQAMLGKAVEVDGCCIGHLADMTLEQNMNGVRIHLEIAPTSETINKMGEYAKIMSVINDKNC